MLYTIQLIVMAVKLIIMMEICWPYTNAIIENGR